MHAADFVYTQERVQIIASQLIPLDLERFVADVRRQLERPANPSKKYWQDKPALEAMESLAESLMTAQRSAIALGEMMLAQNRGGALPAAAAVSGRSLRSLLDDWERQGVARSHTPARGTL